MARTGLLRLRQSRIAILVVCAASVLVACVPATPVAPTIPPPTPAALAAGAAKTVTLPAPEQTTVKLGHSAAEVNQFTVKFAEDLELYRQYGFDSTEVLFLDGTKLVQALVGGQIDAGVVASAPVLSSLLTDTPLITVAMYLNRATDNLVGVSSVKSAADLKGKTIAIGGFGGGPHASAILALAELGLTANDVTLQNIGDQTARLAALQAGSVGAAILDVVIEPDVRQQGFNVLVRLPDAPRQIARAGLVMRREWYEKNPNAALALVAANLHAQQALFTQTDQAIDGFVRWTQATDRTASDRAIRSFHGVAQRDLRWTQAGWDIHREVLAAQTPNIASVDVTHAYTFAPLDRLREIGFNDAVGVPRP